MDAAQQYPAAALVSAALFAAIVAGLYLRNKYSYWLRRGIGGPAPVPLIGTVLPLIFRDRWALEKEWTRRYGKLYGTYQALKPQLVVGDAEVIRQITVKDFDAFPNHELSELFNKYQREFLFFLQDDRWRRVRGLMSPTFTSGKIKRMYQLLDACADDLVGAFDEARRPPLDPRRRYKSARPARELGVVNLKELFSLFTMDAIATCCYGLKLKRELGTTSLQAAASRNDFVRITYKLFNFTWARFLTAVVVPRRLLVKLGWSMSNVADYAELVQVAERLIASRRAQPPTKRFDDYMQILLEASSDDKLELGEMDSLENHHAGLTHESLLADQRALLAHAAANGSGQDAAAAKGSPLAAKIALTDSELLANVMFLLAVGLETTASLLTASVYALAHHRDVQDRLHGEIAAIAQWDAKRTGVKFEYEALTACKYLDAVISEALRTATPLVQVDRWCAKDYLIEKYNLRVPKGAKLQLDLYGVMNNAEYWPEPDRFDPDRFMPGRRERIVPGSYCPFGLGPRHCLGMRFSLTETKLALAKLLVHFRFEPAPDTAYPPTSRGSIGLANMNKPLVRALRRDE